jgi:hypothetical protein
MNALVLLKTFNIDSSIFDNDDDENQQNINNEIEFNDDEVGNGAY